MDSLGCYYPHILAYIIQLKVGFIFENMDECNLDLLRELYANWFPNTQGNSVKMRGQIMKLTAEALNYIPCTGSGSF